MPFSYEIPKRTLALKLAQLKGVSQATLESAYIGSWAAALDGAEIPITAFRDAILSIAKEIAQVIATSSAHPYRSMLYGRSANIANLGSSPTVDQNGVEFIGVFDAVRNASNLHLMTYQPSQIIDDISDAFFADAEIYNYNTAGNYVQFPPPTTNIFFEGCIWSESAQTALYEADGDCPLPEACEAMLCDGVMERSAQVGWTDAAQVMPYYSNLYRQGLAELASMGQTRMPLSSANPVSG